MYEWQQVGVGYSVNRVIEKHEIDRYDYISARGPKQPGSLVRISAASESSHPNIMILFKRKTLLRSA
jgi:hypothetical protein